VQKTQLGETELAISRIGFGAWATGGSNWKLGWSGQDDGDSVAALERALKVGITWIDTAPAYGLGHSETIIGQVLRGAPPPRPLVFTKCGAIVSRDYITFSLETDSIRRELESSLERLGIDTIDLYQLHRPLPEPDLEQGWETLLQLRDEGLVRCIGVSNFSVAELERIQTLGAVQTIQPPYSLMQPTAAEALLPCAERHRIGVIVYSPLGSGLLTGTMTPERLSALPVDDWRRHDSRFSTAALSRSLELAPRLLSVAQRHDASPGEVAIAWTLSHPAVQGAIVGFRRPEQVDEMIGAIALELTPDDLDLLSNPCPETHRQTHDSDEVPRAPVVRPRR
jgi:aryl-alcohol dehydrogenase-like predicted oxidoreductase